jgi:hypothetical protein
VSEEEIKKILINLFTSEMVKIKPSRLNQLFADKQEGEYIEINVMKEVK